jgi:hypothetical protein
MSKRSLTSLLFVRARRVISSFSPRADHVIPPVAVLVDGENISSDLAVHILAAAGKLGYVTIKRVYGNWRHPSIIPWQTVANHYSFKTVLHAHPVSGKNGADIALTVDAMDLLHQGISYFCLASSDSDYIPLIKRLRESGCFVLGIGRSETHEALKAAYNVFLTVDELLPASSRSAQVIPPPKEKKPDTSSSSLLTAQNGNVQVKALASASEADSEAEKRLIALLTKAYELVAAKGKSEWVSTHQLGTVLQQLQPGFKPKLYGSSKLKGLIQKYPHVFQTQPLGSGHIELRIIKPE